MGYNFDGASTGGGGSFALRNSASESAPQEMLYSAINEDLSYLSIQPGSSGGSGGIPITAPVDDDGLSEKIIYTVSAFIETIDFDESVERVYALITYNRAFIETANIEGRNHAQRHYGWQTYRTASFTIRVPRDRLNDMTANLETIGNVTTHSSDAQNITAQFTDSQSRLTAMRVQEERLLDMLSKADNVTDMIALEERLAEVRYQIEALTSTLRNWQNRVDYSTLSLYIYEVEVFTEMTPPPVLTYWQQIGDGLDRNVRAVGRFFMNLFKWLIINLPVLVILAVIAIIITLIVRRQIKKSKKRYM